MTEREMQCFFTVAKCMSFTEAAKELYISQPALSKQISKLEEDLGFALFLRSKKGVALSPGGMVLLQGYPSVRNGYFALLEKARQANEGKTGSLHIGIQEGQNMDERILAQIRSFRMRYPQVTVELTSYPYWELLNQLRRNAIDIGLCLQFGKEDFYGLQMQALYDMSSYIVLARNHPLSEQLAVPNPAYNLLDGLPVLVVGNELVPQGAPFVEEQCQVCNIRPLRTQMIPSYSALYFHLAMGDGFALMNQNMWFFDKGLRFFLLPEEIFVTRVACWPMDSSNPAVPLFLSAVE